MPATLGQTRIGRAWLWWAHLCGLGVVALGLAYGLVRFYAVDGEIVRSLGPARDVSTPVPPGGTLAFTIDFERYDSCPGTITESFSPRDAANIIIVRQRPALSNQVKQYRDVRVNTQIPAQLGPGRWRYTQTVRSTCPSGQHDDLFTELEFEIAG